MLIELFITTNKKDDHLCHDCNVFE